MSSQIALAIYKAEHSEPLAAQDGKKSELTTVARSQAPAQSRRTTPAKSRFSNEGHDCSARQLPWRRHHLFSPEPRNSRAAYLREGELGVRNDGISCGGAAWLRGGWRRRRIRSTDKHSGSAPYRERREGDAARPAAQRGYRHRERGERSGRLRRAVHRHLSLFGTSLLGIFAAKRVVLVGMEW
jgi:hypothetical protein